MDPDAPIEPVGIKLKQIRQRLDLTLREVETLSRRLAREKQNQDFYISRGWLNNVENGSYTPDILKLYSLGVIYHIHWSNIFAIFDLHLSDVRRDQALFPLPKVKSSNVNHGRRPQTLKTFL